MQALTIDLAAALGGLAYGGDYAPEQWPEEVWAQDVRLMREAGVNLVTVGVFAWALLEPVEGRYEFGWLDRVLDLLDGAAIKVDLATATASPPPWLSLAYPNSLPVDEDGRQLWPGSRQAYCPSSPDFRRAAGGLTEALATRYGSHPALVLWHVSNEYGAHVPHCYCDTSAVAFRRWLAAQYGSIEALNQAWATAFWSQCYADWAQVLPPRASPAQRNPAQLLDFYRFSNDEHLACFRAERDVLRRLTPQVPVTTNFMIAHAKWVHYRSWAGEVDVVSNDHYSLSAAAQDIAIDAALAGDISRGVSGGRPWLLMEHAPSAVNWQPRNFARPPGQLRRNSLGHVARGADSLLFFQWRASRAGAEKFHSALLPHAGTETKLWHEAVGLGQDVRQIAAIAGSRVQADVAILWDWPAWWALELDGHPSVDVTYLDQIRSWYCSLWRRNITVDAVHPEADLTAYRLVLVPSLYLISDVGAQNLADYAEQGGHLAVGHFSGIVDEHDAVRLGGYPGAFRDLLGVHTEEFFPLPQGGSVRLSNGWTATVWTELLHADDAEVMATYVDGPLPATPAVTRRARGGGAAWYVATRLDQGSLDKLLLAVADDAGVTPVGVAPPGVELVRRRHAPAGPAYLFVLNHTDQPADVAAIGPELLTGTPASGTLTVAGGGVAVVCEE